MDGIDRVFMTGTYRCGGNFLCGRLNAYERVLILGDLFHYFRFVYEAGRSWDRDRVREVAEAFRWRLTERFALHPRWEEGQIEECELSDAAVYDLLASSLIALESGAEIRCFGEKTAQDWNLIPEFLALFPEGRAIHIVRDPRAVLASWRKVTIQPHPLYLDAIYTACDSMRKVTRFRSSLPADRYLALRYEDLVREPRPTMERVAAFLNIPFDAGRLDSGLPTPFKQGIDGAFGARGALKPFDPAALECWKRELDAPELALAQHVLEPELVALDYEPLRPEGPDRALEAALATVRAAPYLAAQQARFEAGQDCRAGYPNDPRSPGSWGPRGLPKKKAPAALNES